MRGLEVAVFVGLLALVLDLLLDHVQRVVHRLLGPVHGGDDGTTWKGQEFEFDYEDRGWKSGGGQLGSLALSLPESCLLAFLFLAMMGKCPFRFTICK